MHARTDVGFVQYGRRAVRYAAAMASRSTLTMLAPDLAAAQKFDCGLPGFAVEATAGADLVKLHQAGCARLLSRCERPSRPDDPFAAQVAPGLAVADVAAALQRLRAAKVDLVCDHPQEFPAGRLIAARSGR